uniref:DUF676 domain-containing protein n=1 Tax=Heligmosomoides polygyrus TaxID=6339 RepID=A0A183GJN0_HELPZ
LVVFVHGLEGILLNRSFLPVFKCFSGSCDDLSSYRNIFRLVSANVPGFHYLLSASNHAKTWSDIDQMADNLLEEVHSYMTRYSELPTRVSFVAHSLGGVIVRAAVSREEASEWLVPRLHCLLTINSPHLGLAYVGKGVNLGIQFMQWYVSQRILFVLSSFGNSHCIGFRVKDRSAEMLIPAYLSALSSSFAAFN